MFTLIVRYLAKSVFFLVATIPLSAKIVVFWQNGFPTVDSEAVSHQALQSALQGEEQLYANSDALNLPTTLAGASLLVLPYGSAFPAERWAEHHLLSPEWREFTGDWRTAVSHSGLRRSWH